jgi:hypothetical protein
VTERVRTWAELEDWFTGAREGLAVFYSPDTSPDWDDLWMRLSDSPEIGRGMRSFSLSNEDVRWLHRLLSHHFNQAQP